MDEGNNERHKMTKISEVFVWQNPNAADWEERGLRSSAFTPSLYSADDNGSDV